MNELSVLQVTPAGFLALHGPLVASTPALLAWTAAVAAGLAPAGNRAPARNGAPAGRWLIVITGVAAAWLLLALALLPGGASAAYQPGNSPVSLHGGAVMAALGCSLAGAWCARRRSPFAWGMWCGAGLLVPLICGALLERLYA